MPLNAAMLPVVLLAAAMTFVWARSTRAERLPSLRG